MTTILSCGVLVMAPSSGDIPASFTRTMLGPMAVTIYENLQLDGCNLRNRAAGGKLMTLHALWIGRRTPAKMMAKCTILPDGRPAIILLGDSSRLGNRGHFFTTVGAAFPAIVTPT